MLEKVQDEGKNDDQVDDAAKERRGRTFDGLESVSSRGEVMYDGDGDDNVEGLGANGQVEVVHHGHLVLTITGDLDQLDGLIVAEHIEGGIHAEILAVTATLEGGEGDSEGGGGCLGLGLGFTLGSGKRQGGVRREADRHHRRCCQA